MQIIPFAPFWMTKPSRYGRGFEPRRDRLTAASGEHALCHPPLWPKHFSDAPVCEAGEFSAILNGHPTFK